MLKAVFKEPILWLVYVYKLFIFQPKYLLSLAEINSDGLFIRCLDLGTDNDVGSIYAALSYESGCSYDENSIENDFDIDSFLLECLKIGIVIEVGKAHRFDENRKAILVSLIN